MSQNPNLARVGATIGDTVTEFVARRFATAPEFTAAELRAFVAEWHGSAPASPDRILRLGRANGLFDYALVSRPRSLYRVTRAPAASGQTNGATEGAKS